MIYLIDDKELRQQQDYHWTKFRFEKYKEFIIPIYTLEALDSKKEQIFQKGNVILYHDSFLDNTNMQTESTYRRNELIKFAKNGNFQPTYLVFFSGGIKAKELSNNIAYLSVADMYNNLEIFVKYSQYKINLEYLLFGENPQIESELSDLLDSALLKSSREAVVTVENNNNLYVKTSNKNISNPLSTCAQEVLFNKVDDSYLSEKISDWLNKQQYDNIFIPLCFGPTLSDFNGLRLACLIRCTKSKNQLSRILIYGFVGFEYLIQNEYFNILKTKNIVLIPFSKKSIGEFAQQSINPLTNDELVSEIGKLQLKVPSDYYDDHAIANEWGIYQMARNANIPLKDIEGFDLEKFNSLYFKWLITKNDLHTPISEDQIIKQREYKVELPKPKIVGRINLDRI
jgi:hypothetical protein